MYSHSICILHDNYSGLYGKVGSYLSAGYAVVYAVETSVADTIQRMNAAGIKAEKYVADNTLTILDRNSVYSQSRTRLEGRLVLETWKTIISETSQKGKFNGVAVMGMPEPFFETINHQKLVEYEELVSREFDGSFEAVCCYMQGSVADLPLKYLISLLNSHQYIVTGVEENTDWYHAKVLDLIGKGLEKTVGKKTSKLAFEAMKSMYKIDERAVIAQPAVFENAIRKMFADSAETVLHAIKDEIMKDILFESHPNDVQRVPVHFLLCPSCHWSTTTIANWKPEFCPVCHHSAVRSVPVNYRE